MRAFEKRVKNSEWRGFHCNRSSHFFVPFVSWFYLGYTIKVTKCETLYLKKKYKKKGIKLPIFCYFPRFSKKQFTSF